MLNLMILKYDYNGLINNKFLINDSLVFLGREEEKRIFEGFKILMKFVEVKNGLLNYFILKGKIKLFEFLFFILLV